MTAPQPLTPLGAPTDWSARLREQGLRVTRQRLAVLEALEAHPHATVEELHAHAVASCATLTAQAVYLMLDDLARAELVRRLDAPRSAARFETRVGDNHHHLQCVECGRIVDIDCVVGEAPCLHPSEAHGFALDIADVLFRGRCPACVEVGARSAPPSGTH